MVDNKVMKVQAEVLHKASRSLSIVVGILMAAFDDALPTSGKTIIEVFVNKLGKREPFHLRSIICEEVAGNVAGLKALGYESATIAMARFISEGRAS